MKRVPISVLTGFLGSGKTTILSSLLKRPELGRTAVIINEFGEVGLDHQLIETSEEDLISLTTGCLCCVAQGDLSRTVGDLLARRRLGQISFEQIIVETTGLADPIPILQSFLTDPVLAEGVMLKRVITTLDAVLGEETLKRREEARRQAACADGIIITKSDLADACATEQIVGNIHALNSVAEVKVASFGEIDPMFLLSNTDTRNRDHNWSEHSHIHGHTDVITLRRSEPVHAAALPLFFEALAEVYGPRLLRVKGLVQIVEVPDTPGVIHGVQNIFHPLGWLDTWPNKETGTSLTLIGEDLSLEFSYALLSLLNEEVSLAKELNTAPN